MLLSQAEAWIRPSSQVLTVKLESAVRTPYSRTSRLKCSSTSTATGHLKIRSCTGKPTGVFNIRVHLKGLLKKIKTSFCLESTSSCENYPKKPIYVLLYFSYAQNREGFAWGRPECSPFCPFTQLILVLQLYFSIHFNGNITLTVGNLQHVELVSLWFYQKMQVKGLAYRAELLMPIPYLPPGNFNITLSFENHLMRIIH